MDNMTIGRNIAQRRKEAGFTQDTLAEKTGVSAQAVSKWENGISCPDISIFPKLAEIFACSIDELFSVEVPQATRLLKEDERKDRSKMLLKIRVLSSAGDRVSVNLPLALLEVILKMDKDAININGMDFSKVNWDQILALIDHGVIGKLVEVQSADGDLVEIYVE